MSRPRTAGAVRRYVVSHLLAVIAEWGALIGLLVHAFDQSGARATGYASIATVAPYAVLSAATARLGRRRRPGSVRFAALVVQVVGYGIAAGTTLSDGPLVVAVAGVALASAAVTALRPCGAVLLPALVRSTRELTTSNVRVGHCESISVLVGPLVATGLLELGGGGMVLAGCAVLTAIATVLSVPELRDGPPAAELAGDIPVSGTDARRWKRVVRPVLNPYRDLAEMVRRPQARALLAAETVQYMLVGAFDIILVVIAGQHIDLGPSGAGILTTMFGAGAFLSIVVSGRAARRQRLGPLMLVMLGVIAVASLAFGLSTTFLVAAIALPVLGCTRSLLDLLARLLLQRSAPPAQLPSVFGALETSSGVGVLLGSVLAQVMIVWSGAGAALIAVGALYGVLVVLLARPLRRADDGADVPVVAMSLLRRLPVFEPLPAPELERIARSAVEVSMDAGEVVIRQGDHGDRFYAVVDGEFDIVMSGEHVRTVWRAGCFGEVALLADVPRTATVTATEAGQLLAIERGPFLVAVTGYDSSRQAAWGVIRSMELDQEVLAPEPGSVPATAGASTAVPTPRSSS